MERTFFEPAKSIAGAALAGLGVFILYENLDRPATQLSHLLGTFFGGTLAGVPTVVLVASRFAQTYPADHQEFLRALALQIFVSCWPLLLVMAGMVLSREAYTDHVKTLPKKRLGTCRSDNGLFDAKVGRLRLNKEKRSCDAL